jgi:hypothetical protein
LLLVGGILAGRDRGATTGRSRAKEEDSLALGKECSTMGDGGVCWGVGRVSSGVY